MIIDMNSWTNFKLPELFSFHRGNISNISELQDGKIPLVTAYTDNNGVSKFIDTNNINIFDGNCLTVANTGQGSVFRTFYQDKRFAASNNITVLRPKFKLTSNIGLFVTCLCWLEIPKYSYGRIVNNTALNNTLIKLPTKGSIPDWEFMNNYIMSLNICFPKTSIKQKENKLSIISWKEFRICDLFDITGTKTTRIEELENCGRGKYPYVTTQAVDNGVANYYNFSTENGNVLTIDSAVLGFCTYQERDFSASDHVEKLIPKFNMNKYIGLFLTTILNKEIYKYSYGRKANQIKIRNTMIKLPATVDEKPDWQYMEDYIKSLPYADRI